MGVGGRLNGSMHMPWSHSRSPRHGGSNVQHGWSTSPHSSVILVNGGKASNNNNLGEDDTGQKMNGDLYNKREGSRWTRKWLERRPSNK